MGATKEVGADVSERDQCEKVFMRETTEEASGLREKPSRLSLTRLNEQTGDQIRAGRAQPHREQPVLFTHFCPPPGFIFNVFAHASFQHLNSYETGACYSKVTDRSQHQQSRIISFCLPP